MAHTRGLNKQVPGTLPRCCRNLASGNKSHSIAPSLWPKGTNLFLPLVRIGSETEQGHTGHYDPPARHWGRTSLTLSPPHLSPDLSRVLILLLNSYLTPGIEELGLNMCPLAFLCLMGMCEQLTAFLSLLTTPSALIFHDTVSCLRERCMLVLRLPPFTLQLDFFNHHSIPEGSTGRRNGALRDCGLSMLFCSIYHTVCYVSSRRPSPAGARGCREKGQHWFAHPLGIREAGSLFRSCLKL